MIFIVRSFIVLLLRCPRLGEGCDLANMFTPPHSVYVPVQSHEPVIQWLSFVYVLHLYIFVFRSFFVQKLGRLGCSFELFYIVLSMPFIADYTVWALRIIEGRIVTHSC